MQTYATALYLLTRCFLLFTFLDDIQTFFFPTSEEDLCIASEMYVTVVCVFFSNFVDRLYIPPKTITLCTTAIALRRGPGPRTHLLGLVCDLEGEGEEDRVEARTGKRTRSVNSLQPITPTWMAFSYSSVCLIFYAFKLLRLYRRTVITYIGWFIFRCSHHNCKSTASKTCKSELAHQTKRCNYLRQNVGML